MTLTAHRRGSPEARRESLVALGARVRELRLAREMTQAELAVATGLHRTSIITFEGGELDIGAGHLAAMAAAPGVRPGSLFSGT